MVEPGVRRHVTGGAAVLAAVAMARLLAHVPAQPHATMTLTFAPNEDKRQDLRVGYPFPYL